MLRYGESKQVIESIEVPGPDNPLVLRNQDLEKTAGEWRGMLNPERVKTLKHHEIERARFAYYALIEL